MSALTTFLTLGFHHIVDLDAMDHLLFLIALAAVYRLQDWRSALWVITAFTVGHSITLAMAVIGVVRLPTSLIEFLIPLTIVATCAENLFARARAAGSGHRKFRALLAGVFGLVHGSGFANYLQSLFVDRVAVPLVGFNLGIELGQVVILMGATGAFFLVDWMIRRVARNATPAAAFRMRLIGVSAVCGVFAVHMAAMRSPL